MTGSPRVLASGCLALGCSCATTLVSILPRCQEDSSYSATAVACIGEGAVYFATGVRSKLGALPAGQADRLVVPHGPLLLSVGDGTGLSLSRVRALCPVISTGCRVRAVGTSFKGCRNFRTVGLYVAAVSPYHWH